MRAALWSWINLDSLMRLSSVCVSSLRAETEARRLCLCCSQDPVEEERGRRLRGHHLLHLLQQHTLPGPRHHRLLLPAQELQPLRVSFLSPRTNWYVCVNLQSRIYLSSHQMFSTLTSFSSSNYILSISASSGLIALLSTGSKWSSSEGGRGGGDCNCSIRWKGKGGGLQRSRRYWVQYCHISALWNSQWNVWRLFLRLSSVFVPNKAKRSLEEDEEFNFESHFLFFFSYKEVTVSYSKGSTAGLNATLTKTK